MSEVTVKLAGASYAWLEMNSSWGALDQDDPLDKDARKAVLAANRQKVGKGSRYTATMPEEQAESVWRIMESIVGNAETWSVEERGDDVYTFRAMRRDADRLRESLEAVGYTFVPHGYFTVAVAPKARYRDYQDRLDLVICGDCSTKVTLALIERDEIAEHDAWHAEATQ